MVSPFVDDDNETTIIHLEMSYGDFVYITWPTCPFDSDDVSRINNGILSCTITYTGQRKQIIGLPLLYISESMKE